MENVRTEGESKIVRSMKVLYVAPYSQGSTSRMRGEYLKTILAADEFTVVDTQQPINGTPRLFRSFGWRFKKGPLISNINSFIAQRVPAHSKYDLVWVDKAVFIKPELVQLLKRQAGKLVHFTPDPAFTYHKSQLFNQAVSLYDHCITTKTYELEYYRRYGADPILCSQGFDPAVHKPYHRFRDKQGVVFIGHFEAEREEIISLLLENGIKLTLAGIRWERFGRRHRGKSNLVYLGNGLFGTEYAKAISSAKIGLGLLSKWVPEQHTTRTFEIPACGTALATERNADIGSRFNDSEVIYFTEPRDLIGKVIAALRNDAQLELLAARGRQKVIGGGYDYQTILSNLVKRIYQ